MHLRRQPGDSFAGAQSALAALIRDGSLVTHEQILDGLGEVPASIRMLCDGLNVGRLLIRP